MQPAVDSFLKTVLQSGILNAERLKAACRTIPRESRDDADAVAEHFVKSGILSRYQATKLLAGQAMGLVLGPYQVVAPIGRGGMGAVYLARDTRIMERAPDGAPEPHDHDQENVSHSEGKEHLVALKILPPQRARTEERMLRAISTRNGSVSASSPPQHRSHI